MNKPVLLDLNRYQRFSSTVSSTKHVFDVICSPSYTKARNLYRSKGGVRHSRISRRYANLDPLIPVGEIDQLITSLCASSDYVLPLNLALFVSGASS